MTLKIYFETNFEEESLASAKDIDEKTKARGTRIYRRDTIGIRSLPKF